jgi:hypothetical protein
LLADIVAKVFLGDERKFLEPMMRFTRGNVRDHIASSNIDPRISVMAPKSDAAAEIREIFWVVRFATFATISALSSHSSKHSGQLSAAISGTATGVESRAHRDGDHRSTRSYAY